MKKFTFPNKNKPISGYRVWNEEEKSIHNNNKQQEANLILQKENTILQHKSRLRFYLFFLL
jgi:hypothetical protein